MKALNTLFPVFFMMFLGYLSKVKGWLSYEQKQGANTLIFSILFPILIFNLMAGAQLSLNTLSILLYVFLAFALAYFVGILFGKFTGEKFSHISSYMMPTVEGGAVALPLYLSIVGKSSNTVIYDLAGAIIAFVCVPILVAKQSKGNKTKSELIKDIFTHPFFLAISLGVLVNVTGIYSAIQNSNFAELYNGTLTTVTGPILGTILFMLGYDFSLDFSTLGSMARLIALRVLFNILIIAGFYVLFPQLMADKTYLIGVLIYFMSPTGFAMPLLIEDLYKSKEERTFTATFISLYMMITLIAYIAVVVFVA